MIRRGVSKPKTIAAALAASVCLTAPAWAWEPTKPVTLVIPAGTGGGADQMARFIQGVVQKHNLMKQPLIVINKAGGAGAEGFLEMKSSANDPQLLAGVDVQIRRDARQRQQHHRRVDGDDQGRECEDRQPRPLSYSRPLVHSR